MNNNYGLSKCVNVSCVDTVLKPQVDSALVSRSATSSAAAAPENGGLTANSTPSSKNFNIIFPSGSNSTTTDAACKFESSPGGCRFGAYCRFKHAHTTLSGAEVNPLGSFSGTSRSSGSPSTQCIYFQKGNCQFGNSCRFSHL
jgi:hypothetical protein